MAETSLKKENHRVVLLSLITLLIAGLLTVQLFNRAVLSHSVILASAQNQQISKQNIDPKRGTIYVTNSDGIYPIATTDEKYMISAVPKNIKDKQKAAHALSQATGKDEKTIFDKINNNKPYLPPFDQRIEKGPAQTLIDLNLPGVIVQPNYVRYYPEGQLASQVLGFVDYQNKGRYGVESYYNEELKGLGSTIFGEKDNKGRLISPISDQAKAKNGDTLVLTIDQNVQYAVEQKLADAIKTYGATSGLVVIIDIKTGAIIAMASNPTFDPNKFNEVKPEDQGNFNNPIISSVYEPGSIMKPIVVAAGLDGGQLKADDEGDFGENVIVQGYTINTATLKAFGHETVTQVLENSDNVAMVSYANKIGNTAMHDYFEKFGFGTKFGIDSSGETTGSVLNVNKWHDINRATMSFGQGISVTPLQILMAYQAIANEGKLVMPHLVSKIIKPDGTEQDIVTKELRQVIKPETAATVLKMLISVVVNGEGKRAGVLGYQIGGKTGTAQIPNKDSAGYETDAHIGSFAGVVPADNPRFAMLVKLDRPTAVKFAESSAAPTFSEIAKYLLQYYQIPKSN